MICVHCRFDSKYKDRQATPGRCPACKGPLAFEPRAGALITDLGFKNAIDAVSAKGNLRWGVEHLYYEVCRRVGGMTPGQRKLRRMLLLGTAGSAFYLMFHRAWVFIAVLIAVGGLVYLWPRLRRRKLRLSWTDFDRMWSTWTRVHDAHPKGLIVRKEPLPQRRAPERDIPLYSFDRAVICDRDRTVDLLLANNFHFENNCAVLSIAGYPPGPFPTVREMLKRNPRLQVFALHDATEVGCRMAYRLATEGEWFKGQARIVDVGLRPAHGRVFTGLLLGAQAQQIHAGHGITASEARWLSRHVLELAAIRPEQALKRLYRAINAASVREPRRTRDSDTGSGGGSGDGGGSGADGAAMGEHGGEFGGAGASGDFAVDADSFGSDAGDMDGDGDGSG
ncbi:MAG: hypothetical protein ACRELS_03620 [Candidatus Rokuibacteriota bacterium]